MHAICLIIQKEHMPGGALPHTACDDVYYREKSLLLFNLSLKKHFWQLLNSLKIINIYVIRFTLCCSYWNLVDFIYSGKCFYCQICISPTSDVLESNFFHVCACSYAYCSWIYISYCFGYFIWFPSGISAVIWVFGMV